MTNLGSVLKSRDITLSTEFHLIKAVFSSSHVWMWDHKDIWALKNWSFWTVMLEKTLESPLDCKEIKPVNPKGNQLWIFIGRTDAEVPILWSPAKSRLIRKDPDAGKDWRQEKEATEDEIVGWHHQLNGHEFEQAPGDGEEQGSLAGCNPWGYKESDMTEWLNKKSLEGEPGPCPKVGQLFLHCSSLVSVYPPWLATVWNCPLELKKVQETGDTERISSPGAP